MYDDVTGIVLSKSPNGHRHGNSCGQLHARRHKGSGIRISGLGLTCKQAQSLWLKRPIYSDHVSNVVIYKHSTFIRWLYTGVRALPGTISVKSHLWWIDMVIIHSSCCSSCAERNKFCKVLFIVTWYWSCTYPRTLKFQGFFAGGW